MTLWHDGDVLELLKEGATIQGTLKSVNTRNTIGEISKKFVIKMQQGNINGAIKLLTNNMQNGVLPINEKKNRNYWDKNTPKDLLLQKVYF